MADALARIWQTVLDVVSAVVIPDWAALVNLIPVILVVGVLAPLLSLAALAWILYALRRPRTRLVLAEGPRAAAIIDGSARYPDGEPYCPVDKLIFTLGRVDCERCGCELLLRCPKCGTGRAASLMACGNCGLELKTSNRGLAIRRAGPPAGGAAAA